MASPKPVLLRSPRESLGGYILLPRLIDKVRFLAKGQLPQANAANVLGAEYTLDGRFLTFTGLNAQALRHVIVSGCTDDEVLEWVQRHARRNGVRNHFVSTKPGSRRCHDLCGAHVDMNELVSGIDSGGCLDEAPQAASTSSVDANHSYTTSLASHCINMGCYPGVDHDDYRRTAAFLVRGITRHSSGPISIFPPRAASNRISVPIAGK